MRKFLVIVPLLILSSLAALAQEEAPQAEPADTTADARILQVAVTLKLRQDQVQAILPLLRAAEERVQQRKEALDGIWERSQQAFESVAASTMSRQEPDARSLATVERAKEQHAKIMEQTDADLDKIADQVRAKLDKTQLALLETPEAREARADNRARFNGAPSLSAYLARYLGGMRALEPEEYDTLRVAMGLRLAEALVAPDNRLYNNAVADVLRLMDIVRRMTDAEYAQRRAELPAAIARALGLQEQALVAAAPVSLEDFMEFLSNPRSKDVLAKWQAPPALGVEQ